MKITPQILSIPPYISTSWKSIASLHLESQALLIITLHSGARIEIPALDSNLIEMIFAAHTRYLEEEQQIDLSQKNPNPKAGHFSLEMAAMQSPLALLDGFNPLAHDPTQADTPPLPEEILSKVAEIAKAMGVNEGEALPQPEEECNCLRCQIARAVQKGIEEQKKGTEDFEEEVTDADLSFASWSVHKKEENVYLVSHPLEREEQYQVHLGNPVGCTCGHTRCEHIRAVLQT